MDWDLPDIGEKEIQDYLSGLVKKRRSDSYINQAINSIKFYYEVVMGMPNRFYSEERPLKKERLPEVLSKEKILLMINRTVNRKHRCILKLLYSAGLRRAELQNLKPEDINSDRMLIRVQQGKGKKDRNTLLSKSVLHDLREYYKKDRPEKYLFEGQYGRPYSSTSIRNLVVQAASRARIKRKVTPHMLRHSFLPAVLSY
ncbi:MAG: tyrosine-type recombinase/integrase [Bacteroidota bacterium]